MSVSWSDVVAFAPELSGVSAGAQTAILAYVNGDGVNVDVFDGDGGSATHMARCYLAAHIATMGRFGASGGPLSSQSAGGLSRSFGAWSSGGVLGTTGYGRLFTMLAAPGASGAHVL